MNQVTKMPTEGQFVVVYEYKGQVWASNIKIEDGILYEYGVYHWSQCEDYFRSPAHSIITFYVNGEEK